MKDSEGEDSEENMTEYGLADVELGFEELIAEHADDNHVALRLIAANDLGEYEDPITYDHKAMLKELNKVQQFALELQKTGERQTAIVNTVPSDRAFLQALTDVYLKKETRTRE